MGDMGDYWRDVREHRKEAKSKRWNSNTKELERLAKAGKLRFQIGNAGTGHMIVNENIDLWLSTGTWLVRGQNRRGHGFKQLLHFINPTEARV